MHKQESWNEGDIAMTIQDLSARLAGLAVFRELLADPVIKEYAGLLRALASGAGREQTAAAAGRFEAALFAADRIDHITNSVNGIVKKLEEGYTVLCDRYYFSSFAYNGGFAPLEWIIELNKPAMNMLRPDLTIFLDLPAEESMKRVSRRGETERYETMDKQKRIRDKYFDVFRMFAGRENIAVIRSEEEKERTQANIRQEVGKLFGGNL